jgi:hypothetical protein
MRPLQVSDIAPQVRAWKTQGAVRRALFSNAPPERQTTSVTLTGAMRVDPDGDVMVQIEERSRYVNIQELLIGDQRSPAGGKKSQTGRVLKDDSMRKGLFFDPKPYGVESGKMP